MLYLNLSIVTSVTFFLSSLYLVLSLATYLYTLPLFYSNYVAGTKKLFHLVNHNTVFIVLSNYILLLITLTVTSLYCTTSLWFNHVIVSAFQVKFCLLVLVSFLVTLKLLLSFSILSSRELYDYLITNTFFAYWLQGIFFSNSIFSLIFSIEILSTLIFTLIITSTFSTSTRTNASDLSYSYLFQNATPYAYIKSTLFFYWISLLSSVNLFVFLLLFYFQYLTFDWFLLPHLATYICNNSSYRDSLLSFIVFTFLLLSIFLKSGIAPLFIWKPTFFKGLSIVNILFYILFFYLFLFIFFLNFISSLLNILLINHSLMISIFVFPGLILIVGVLFESSYLKSFLATSSILNSLLVMLLFTLPIDSSLNFTLL